MIKSNTIVKIATALQRVYNLVLKANPIGLAIAAVTALAGAFYLVNRRKKEAIGIEKGLSDSAKDEIAQNEVRLAQANNLMNTIKSQNISNEQRARLIRKLNTEYKDLLPNLISEKSGVQDIVDAQKDMNKEMAKKIAMIAVQDEMNESVTKAVEAQKLFNSTLKVSDDLATKSQDLFGRVLSEDEAMRLATDFEHVTAAQRLLAVEISANNGLLGAYKIRLEAANAELVEIGDSVDGLAQSLSGATDEGETFNKTFSETLMDLPVKPFADKLTMQLAPSLRVVRDEMINFTAMATQAGRVMSDVFAASIEEAFDKLDEGETRFGNFLSTMLSGLKKLATQFIAAAIAAFALAVAIRLATGTGLAGLGSIKDIFGTMQTVGFMSNIPMMAEGGVVTGPTLAMIGEAGTEAVIPLDRLGEFSGGGSQNVVVTGRISGADILLSNERASRNRTRQRGF